MDSGNTSGSMQSSSGGDEEYDSRPHHSLPPFFASATNPQQQMIQSSSHLLPHQLSSALFDPSSSNLFHSFPQSPPPPNLLHLHSFRPPAPRSDPANFRTDPSTSSQSMLPTAAPVVSTPPSDHTHVPVVTRNPKKRTRASRRAPTTVLTTDTSNFRAMVQEFTGIPAPPFSASSPYPRRLDLFGSGGVMGSLYPLRPSAQKVDQFLIPSSSSPSSTLNVNSTNNIVDANSNINGTSGFNILNNNGFQLAQTMQNNNQLLSFQSLLQPSQVHHGLGAKSSLPLPPPMDDLCMASHGHINASIGGLRGNDNSLWRQSDDHHLYGNNSSSQQPQQRMNNSNGAGATCKVNYSGVSNSSEFHERGGGLDNVPSSRAHEGGGATVDSWLCSEINEAK